MKLRFVTILLLVFLISIILNSPVFSESSEIELPAEIEKMFSKDKITVGIYSGERPPFFMENEEGELYGLDIELAQGIADELGLSLEINREADSYQELYEMLVNEEFDLVISKFSRTFSRSKAINYSIPYASFRWSLMLNSSYAAQKGITEYPMHHLKQASDIKVGVMAGTSWENFAEDLFAKAEIVGYDDWQQVLAALRRKEIIAALYDENEVIKSIYKDPDIALFSTVYILEDKKDDIALAVPASSSHFLSWLNFYLEDYDISYTVNELRDKFPEVYK
ncbi:MAG: substrate-binding periplasmic protein [bacterium]